MERRFYTNPKNRIINDSNPKIVDVNLEIYIYMSNDMKIPRYVSIGSGIGKLPMPIVLELVVTIHLKSVL